MRQAFLYLFLCLGFTVYSQVSPRSWQDHLSINSCNSVTKLGNKIYASYRNGIVYFDEQEISPQKLNKINGLSDVGINLLRTNPYNNKLLVIYDNSNIDVIDVSGKITNYPDFKLKTMTARKFVNEVSFYRQYAYLACGFGIVVFDTDKLEIKDTYYIGSGASNVDVLQVALNDSLIFAATMEGMYRSNHKNKLLNDFNNWKFDTVSLPAGPYCGVVNAGGKILTCYSPFRADLEDKDLDTFYVFTGNNWSRYSPLSQGSRSILKLSATYGSIFSFVDQFGLAVYDTQKEELLNVFSQFNNESESPLIRDAYFDKDFSGNTSYWLADLRFGLYQTYLYYMPDNKVNTFGIDRGTVASIDIFNGKVAVAPSYVHPSGNGKYTREGVNLFSNNEWKHYSPKDPKGNTLIDVTSALIDRKDPSRVWATSWSYGIMEYRDHKLYATYTPSNSILRGHDIDQNNARCYGLSMDNDGNVWFTQQVPSQGLNYFLGRIDTEGKLSVFTSSVTAFTRRSFVDRNNFLWLPHEWEGGMHVIDLDNIQQGLNSGNMVFLHKEPDNGNLGSNAVFCVREDRDGRIWVGTGGGIRIFYNPTAIFSGSGFDAQPIKIIQDGNVELLLGNESVTGIAIDGANNKWVATAYGGVYCFSPDGIRELYHFTADNSPLYSNSVQDIGYDEITGDIYVASEQGLQSFRSTIIQGSETYDAIHAFPNPVKPGYQGTVLVRGLLDNTIVKITDAAGNLVWETKSTGGQIEWPLKTLSGSRVTSGVYLVLAATTTGEVRARTKILVIN